MNDGVNLKVIVKTIVCLVIYIGSYALEPAAIAAATTGSITLYVSTSGDDRADGRSPTPSADNEGPFATLERARDELRALRSGSGLAGGANVVVRGGTYELQTTLMLEAQDSGTEQAPIVYKPFGNEKVVLSGGRTLDNCVTTGAGRLSCDTRQQQLQKLSDRRGDRKRVRGPLPSFDVFMNGEPLQLARWPNSDRQAPGRDTWAHITSAQGSRRRFSYSGEPRLSLRSANDAVIHIWSHSDWFDEYVGIQSISAGNFTLSSPVVYPIEVGRRFSILNTEEGLDAPGEWYYSTATEELRVIPLPGSEQQRPVVSYLDTVIAMRDTQNVDITGFVIEQSRETAVSIRGGQSNSLTDCTIRNTGDFGVHIKGGKEHTVTNSEIHNTSNTGVVLEGGDRNTLVASNHIAIGNNIHNTGRLVRAGKAGLQLKGVGNIARKNVIHHTPSAAVLLKGNDHLVEYNDIHDACEESSDCGAVYVGGDWTYHGNVIRYNRIHDIYGYGMKIRKASTDTVEYVTPNGARGVYLDNAASGIDVVSNLFYRIPNNTSERVPHGRMVQIGGGRHNLIDNNFFIHDGYAIWLDARWPEFPWDTTLVPALKAVPYKSSVWRNRYPRLAAPMKNPRWPEGNEITRNIFLSKPSTLISFRYKIPPNDLKIDNNIVWNQGGSVKLDYYLLKGGPAGYRDWTEWQEHTGHDANSLLVDPHFVDAANGDFALKANSPARKLGIKELPLDEMFIGASSSGVQKVDVKSPPVAGELRVD